MEGGVEEVGGGGARGGEPGFQRVAPVHQFVHLRHDPLLFGERWERSEGQRPGIIPAWGNAPGNGQQMFPSANGAADRATTSAGVWWCDARHKMGRAFSPGLVLRVFSQGVALGWYRARRWR